MYVPLMGTSLSRAGLALEESYDLLRETFTQHSDMITGGVYIVVKPEDMQELGIEEQA